MGTLEDRVENREDRPAGIAEDVLYPVLAHQFVIDLSSRETNVMIAEGAFRATLDLGHFWAGFSVGHRWIAGVFPTVRNGQFSNLDFRFTRCCRIGGTIGTNGFLVQLSDLADGMNRDGSSGHSGCGSSAQPTTAMSAGSAVRFTSDKVGVRNMFMTSL